MTGAISEKDIKDMLEFNAGALPSMPEKVNLYLTGLVDVTLDYITKKNDKSMVCCFSFKPENVNKNYAVSFEVKEME